MASGKNLVFNLGASRVVAGAFSGSGHDVVLDKLASRILEYDFTHDEKWVPSVLAAIRDLVKSEGFGGKARVILPGFLLLTKVIRIAHVEESKRMQMIAFEAQQNMPYPLSEVVWTHEVLSDDGIETEILFLAVKREIVNQLCSELIGAGVTPLSVGAATVLDYNAHRMVFGPDAEDALVLNIGARASNLTFVSPNGFFVRNINYGGNALTQGLADSTGTDFSVAEREKLAYFGNPSGTPENVSQVMEKRVAEFHRKIGQEVTRSVVSYRQQRKAAAPKRILLAGKGALVPGLTEYLEKAQKARVEVFDMAGHVQLDGGLVLGNDRASLTELFGLVASEGGAEGFVHVDLLPQEIKKKAELKKKLPFLAVAAVAVAAAPIPIALAEAEVAAARETELESLKQEQATLQARSGEILDRIDEIRSREEIIRRFESLQNTKYNWLRFFVQLQDALVNARDAWLDDLELVRTMSDDRANPQPEFRLRIQGRMLAREGDSLAVLDREDIISDQDLLTNRIRAISEQIETLEFVDTRLSFRIDFNSIEEGLPLLPFEMVYRVIPEAAL